MSTNEWRPGSVRCLDGHVKLLAGQTWVYRVRHELGDHVVGPQITFNLISTSPEGEVVLRPVKLDDREIIDKTWPEQQFSKENRGSCPFKRVDDRAAKGSHGAWKDGDFLAHEAWDCWNRMRCF